MCCREVIAGEGSIDIPATVPCRHLTVDADPRAPSMARAFVRETVTFGDEEFVADVALVTSELVTNAVIHARTPVEIGVVRDGERVLVSVGDRNLARPEQQPYSDKRTSGRGLRIVRGLVDSWGVTAHSGGKSVWFTLRAEEDRDMETGEA